MENFNLVPFASNRYIQIHILLYYNGGKYFFGNGSFLGCKMCGRSRNDKNDTYFKCIFNSFYCLFQKRTGQTFFLYLSFSLSLSLFHGTFLYSYPFKINCCIINNKNIGIYGKIVQKYVYKIWCKSLVTNM